MSRKTRDDNRLRRLVRDRERLAALSPGGSPERPLSVTSAAVVEVRARAIPCPQCGGELRVGEHTAPSSGLRKVHVSCTQCSSARDLWFRLISDEPN